MNVENKVVIITGARRGIGRATALHFAARGARVIVTDLNEGTAHSTVDEIEANGGQGLAVAHDADHGNQRHRDLPRGRTRRALFAQAGWWLNHQHVLGRWRARIGQSYGLWCKQGRGIAPDDAFGSRARSGQYSRQRRHSDLGKDRHA
ncbi:SDR family NAD(P)-dependent oxidoreductase [Rhizobium leguminosarum]|nr:SDR family NAD(P)-dependent oxidoreductase [Rhizobium leguminosarum]MBY5679898.1 SDR family NAD(P)-dependent oxidoreductase [Rhizobium leguminosarum]